MSAQPEELIDRKHVEQVPEWPEFRVTGDDISGRVPVTRISSWRKLTELLDDICFNRPKTQLIYRGHRRYDWPLTPALGRFDSRKIISADVALAQLRFFRRAVRGRLLDHTLVNDGEDYELWSVGQHHGLLTPLLDWTHSPYVALFFAFEKPDRADETDNPFRAIYVLNKTHVENEKFCPDVSVLEPRKDDHGRLVNQAGLFTYSSYGNTLENFLINSLHDEVLGDVPEEDEAKELAKYICKIYFPNEDRDACLRHLRMMNVHHGSLFPDLFGAAQYCNILVAEEAVHYRQSEMQREPQVEPVATEVPPSIGEAPTAPDEIQSLRDVLEGPNESTEVEPARLELVAQELAAELRKNQYIDWEKRENVKAAMRNAARVVLRRLGYPASAREAVLDRLLGVLKRESQP